MAPKGKGLGKGLGSLFSDMAEISKGTLPNVADISQEEEKTAKMIKVRDIEPNRHQPRKVFDEAELNDLADSIRTYGVITPLIVVKEKDHYMIIAGERRWRAAKIAGVKEVPVVIREYTEQEIAEISLVENIQRSDLNPIEEASAYEKLMDTYGLTQEELSDKIGRSRSAVANALRLLKLPENVREMVRKGDLRTGHAKAILGLEKPEQMEEAAKAVVENDLSVRETEALVKKMLTPQRKKPAKTPLQNQTAYEDTENQLKEVLKTQVIIRRKAENAGKIEIDYYSLEDLERILAHIR